MKFPLIGNERLRVSTDNLIRSRRFPHAFLIEGGIGSGRHTLARYLTVAALCDGEEAPCDICRSCHLFSVGTHPDFVCVTPESGKKNISVEQIRTLRQQVFVKAHIAQHRVFWIDGAERMNEQAQNALLKILEEPPEGVIFVLIALSRTALLDTIVSRCVILSVGIPETGEAAAYLTQRCDNDYAAIEHALAQADGRIGRALELLTGQTTDPTGDAAAEFLRLLLGGTEWELLGVLKPYEKDRAKTDALFVALKTETARQLRENRNMLTRARMLNRFYEKLCQYEKQLKTNVNLTLLFSAMVCDTVQLKNEI